jgi:tripartite-type tricarboxylate transporter receptor subunit TctC
MNRNDRHRLAACIRNLPLFAALALGTASAFGQGAASGLPNRPMQFLIPNPPGGGPDFIARLMAPRFAETLRHNVIVDNRAGANGVVGTEFGARAAPDGSVVTFGNAGTHAINATLYRKLPYDPLRDFSAVSELASAPLVIVAHPQVPAQSIRELIALARKSPGKLNVAIPGATAEVSANALALAGKVKMQNVPYKGGGPATIAVVSGESDLTMTNYAAVGPLADAGKLKILGVTSAQRSAQIPKVPTVAENGLEGYDFSLWYGLFVPSKTPPATVQAIARESIRILNLPEIRERLVATGHVVIASTPEQFSAKVRSEVERFRKIIIDSGMRLE